MVRTKAMPAIRLSVAVKDGASGSAAMATVEAGDDRGGKAIDAG